MRALVVCIYCLMLCLLSSGCESGESNPIGLPAERGVRINLNVVEHGTLRGFLHQIPSPGEIAYLISWANGVNDDGQRNVDKFEINYGDGTGWIDVTADRAFWDYTTESDPAGMTHYFYEEPGTYFVVARATFWDGEVVYSTKHSSQFPDGMPVTILPAAAAGN